MSVLVLVEHDGGEPDELSLQALTLARGLGGTGRTPSWSAAPTRPAQRGRVDVARTWPRSTAPTRPAPGRPRSSQLVDRLSPSAVVAAGTDRGNEVLAHVAARRDLPFAANCNSASHGDDRRSRAARWGGSLLEEARVHARPAAAHAWPRSRSPPRPPAPPAEVRDVRARARPTPTSLVRVAERVSTATAGHLAGRGQGRRLRRPRRRLGRGLRDPRGARRPARTPPSAARAS